MLATLAEDPEVKAMSEARRNELFSYRTTTKE
jgi:hypothetical protein